MTHKANFIELIQSYEWFKKLDMPEQIDVLNDIHDFMNDQDVIIKELYEACHYAFMWHCGIGSKESEIECMEMLDKAIKSYHK